MMKFFLLLSICLFFSCNKNKETDYILICEGDRTFDRTFNKPVVIANSCGSVTEFNNCIFENIEGDALHAAENVLFITRCTFRNINGNGIYITEEKVSSTTYIEGNTFENIQESGIYVSASHERVMISDNTFRNVALKNSTSSTTIHHGIHLLGPNIKVEHNVLHNIGNDGLGNGIELATYGVINSNRIHGAAGHAIHYSNDQAADYMNYKDTLWIQNNMIYDNKQSAISLSSNGSTTNQILSAVVRFNTIVTADQPGLLVEHVVTGIGLDFLANIVVRTDGGTDFVVANLPYAEDKNITSQVDIGFVDFVNRDLNLDVNSTAENYATGLTSFPPYDFYLFINGTTVGTRGANNLDAGADER